MAEAKRLAQGLALADRVRFLGLQTPTAIAAWMGRSRALLQHSLTGPDGDQEGAPVVVMEAQLSGLPVVASRHAGIPELVIDGQTGLLVDEGDGQAMATAIARLGQDAALAARLGQAGRQRCLQRFTCRHHHQQLGALVARLACKSQAQF